MALSRADARLIAEELGKIVGSAGGSGTGAARAGATAGGGGTGGLNQDQADKLAAAYDRIEGTQERLVELSAQEQEISQNRIKRLEQERALKKAIKDGNDAAAQAAEDRIKSLDAENAKLEKMRDTIQEANDAVGNLSDSFSNVFGGPDAVKVEDIFSPKAIGGAITGLTKIAKAQKLSTLAH